MLHSLSLTHQGGPFPTVIIVTGAFLVMAAWTVTFLLFGGEKLYVLPLSAIAVCLSGPASWTFGNAPAGLLALLASLALFAIGTRVAWRRGASP